jgi:hypothetical protein
MAIVRLEGLGKLKKFNDLIGNRTCDLPACSIMPQPTTLPRDPYNGMRLQNYLNMSFYAKLDGMRQLTRIGIHGKIM